jgi:exosortase C (VPDSG-CTERM-specific)
LSLLFWRPLGLLVPFAAKSDFHSHILLIPAISAYLVWIQRQAFFQGLSSSWITAAVFFLSGMGLEVYALAGRVQPWPAGLNNYLSFHTCALVLILIGGMAVFFGNSFLRRAAFPVLLLLFAVPLPPALIERLEILLQHGSAEVAFVMFRLTGTPVFREDLVLQLPGLPLRVAQECSGVRSTFVLFITSLLAGHLFLGSFWRRTVLAFSVIAIGLLRNGFRILTIALLTIHVDRGIMDGPLHHRGGPIFFVLSLFPLLLVLFFLRKSEARNNRPMERL